MKSNRMFFAAATLIAVLLWPAGQTYGQESSREQREKEKQIQEAIDAQKKAVIDQQRSQEEVRKMLEEKNIELQELMKDVQVKIGDPESVNRVYRIYDNERGMRPGNFGDPFVISRGGNIQAFWDNNDAERTSWDFSKSVKESTFSREYVFDVEPTVKNVVMSVNGDCKAGDIRIRIITPGGKTYSEIVIDEFGDLNWKKSFSISEEENKDKAGAWKFDISATKASGYFRISLQTY